MVLYAAFLLGSFFQVIEPTNVIQRYYCVAGEQPIDPNFFKVGQVFISAQPFDVWCVPVY